MTSDHSTSKTSLAERLKKGMREYLFISLYLWICFTALVLYEAAVKQTEHLTLIMLGAAAFKALLLGKFILIGKHINVGSSINPKVLLHRIVWKSVAMMALLLMFKVIEELVVGVIHGHAPAQVISEFLEYHWLQIIAPIIVMLLLLIPLIAYEEIDKGLGKGSIKRMLFENEKTQ